MPDRQRQTGNARRQRRIARRRREIMDAAATVFLEQGYPSATTRAIAEAADIAEGTLYNYFESKRDILMGIFQQLQDETDALLDTVSTQRGVAGPETESKEDLVAVVEQGFDLFLTRLPFARILWAEAWTDDEVLREFAMDRLMTLYARIRAFIVGRMARGNIDRPGDFRAVDPDLATKMVLGLLLAPLLPVMRGAAPPPSATERRAMAEAAVDLMLHGLEVTEYPAEERSANPERRTGVGDHSARPPHQATDKG
jgi:AcrR family transcriptional regulator